MLRSHKYQLWLFIGYDVVVRRYFHMSIMVLSLGGGTPKPEIHKAQYW